MIREALVEAFISRRRSEICELLVSCNMQNHNDLLSNPILAAQAAAAYGQGASLSAILASLHQHQQQRQAASTRLLQDSALLNSATSTPNWFSALSVRPNLSDLHLNRDDPLLLASSIAARRQIELNEAARRDALISDAYERGRKEALISLVRLGGFEDGRGPSQPSVSAAAAIPQESMSHEGKAEDQLVDICINRRSQKKPYFDASLLKDPDPVVLANRRARGGVTEPFPEKLHRMLCEVEEAGEEATVSFFPHGRAFTVHNPARFVTEILPKYFRQSRLSSFQRQLNLYGFTRISQGPDAGGYYHELFLKGRPNLCLHMRRVGVPQNPTKQAAKASSNEPDFYSMAPASEEWGSTGREGGRNK